MAFVNERRGKPFVGDFERFEQELHAKMIEVERELLREELEKADVDAAVLQVNGTTYRRVLRSSQTYLTAAGPVEITRGLYRDGSDPNARCLIPLDLRVGVIDRLWTPAAAKQAVWVVSQMTPQLAEELFERVGNMTPSKSSLDRLPKTLSARWEEDREAFEAVLRQGLVVPEGTVTVAVSIDGVLAPMKDADGVGTRAQAASEGKLTRGPAGYREVGCGTLSFCDEAGKPLSVLRFARMPEPHKATVKKSLAAELLAALSQRPDLRVAKVADGAKDNWTFLHDHLPEGPEVVDFFHAAEHLNVAIGEAYGDGSVEARRRFNDLRHVLRHDEGGVEKVIRALKYLVTKHPGAKRIDRELGYFRANRRRMQYATMAAQGIPIGSGVVEAACKTLVTQRLKGSGMRWGQEGGQAILTVRSWTQSQRFEEAWALLAATYRLEVTTVSNVVDIRSARPGNASG
jgi:hypothetical protein